MNTTGFSVDKIDEAAKKIILKSVENLLHEPDYIDDLVAELSTAELTNGIVVKPTDEAIVDFTDMVTERMREAQVIVKFGR